jgi:PhnB protein
MTTSDRPAWPTVVPMPTYEDVGMASDWLCAAFGFREQQRFSDPAGQVTNTILEVPSGGIVMPGWTGPHYQSPAHHGQTCAAAALWQQTPYIVDGVLITVQDVDQHCARAKAAGARVLSEPEDSGHEKSYRVEDLEGHRWMFSEPAG